MAAPHYGTAGPVLVDSCDLPASVYHGLPGLSSSALKEMGRSPAHFKGRERWPLETTANMEKGTAIHTLILEPHKAKEEVLVLPVHCIGRSKKAKENKAAFLASLSPTAILLTPEAYEDARNAAAAVLANDDAMTWLSEGQPEQSFFAPCPLYGEELGLIRRGRVDYVTAHPESEGRPVMVDLKSTFDVLPREFGNHAAKMGYHVQAAWNIDGYGLCGLPIGNWQYGDYVIVAVESKAPYVVAVYEMPAEVIEAGRRKYMKLLDLWAQCKRADNWPGPAPQLLDFPRWALEA